MYARTHTSAPKFCRSTQPRAELPLAVATTVLLQLSARVWRTAPCTHVKSGLHWGVPLRASYGLSQPTSRHTFPLFFFFFFRTCPASWIYAYSPTRIHSDSAFSSIPLGHWPPERELLLLATLVARTPRASLRSSHSALLAGKTCSARFRSPTAPKTSERLLVSPECTLKILRSKRSLTRVAVLRSPTDDGRADTSQTHTPTPRMCSHSTADQQQTVRDRSRCALKTGISRQDVRNEHPRRAKSTVVLITRRVRRRKELTPLRLLLTFLLRRQNALLSYTPRAAAGHSSLPSRPKRPLLGQSW